MRGREEDRGAAGTDQPAIVTEDVVICEVGGEPSGPALGVLALLLVASPPEVVKKLLPDGDLGNMGSGALAEVLRARGVPWDGKTVRLSHIAAIFDRLKHERDYGPLRSEEAYAIGDAYDQVGDLAYQSEGDGEGAAGDQSEDGASGGSESGSGAPGGSSG